MAALALKINTKTKFSAKQILAGTLFLIFVMISFVVVEIQHLAVSSAQRQIYTSTQATLEFFSQSLDTSAARLDNDFYNLLSNNLDISTLELASDDAALFEAKSNLSQSLQRIYESNDLLNNVFLYSPSGKKAEYLLYSTELLSASEASILKEYIIHICDASLSGAKFSSSNWTVHIVGNIPYLVRIVCNKETFCGGLIRLDVVQRQLGEISHGTMGSSAIFSLDHQLLCGDTQLSDLSSVSAESFVRKMANGNYIVSLMTPDILEITLTIAVPSKSLSTFLSTGLTGFIGICAILILLVFLVYICFFLMYRPFLYLSHSMKTVAKGNLNFRISKCSSVKETDEIYQTFNQMLDEMNHLKIKIYEKELEKEKVTRQFLQMQLKSHFFLNCLNIIYSLAQTKRYELIQELTLCLVQYFRYLSQNSDELVPLKDEIAHIRNYMEIQMMRFPNKISFSCDVEEALFECKIPLLILQTFLENAVKYGLNFSKISPISLCAVAKRKENIDGILFTITDEGKGFSEELLSFYQKKEAILPTGQEHGIGIINVKKRLHLVYGGQEEIKILNQVPNGAQIEIWIPKEASVAYDS